MSVVHRRSSGRYPICSMGGCVGMMWPTELVQRGAPAAHMQTAAAAAGRVHLCVPASQPKGPPAAATHAAAGHGARWPCCAPAPPQACPARGCRCLQVDQRHAWQQGKKVGSTSKPPRCAAASQSAARRHNNRHGRLSSPRRCTTPGGGSSTTTAGSSRRYSTSGSEPLAPSGKAGSTCERAAGGTRGG